MAHKGYSLRKLTRKVCHEERSRNNCIELIYNLLAASSAADDDDDDERCFS